MKKFFILAACAVAVAACGGGKKAAGDGAVSVRAGTRMQVVALSDSLIRERKADTIAFGRVKEGETAVREFTIRNAGDKAVVITRLDLSCGCVAADYPTRPIRPGEEAPMKLTLDTRDMGGWIFKTAVMHTSLGAQPYRLCVTAEIE